MKKPTFLILLFTFSFLVLYAQTGIITTVAGTGVGNYNGDNRQATTAELNQDGGVAVDATGNIYIADSQNNRIRKVSTTGNITTIAGTGRGGYSGNGGQATAAEITYPICVRVDSLGNIYFSDAGNALIRKVSVAGVITNLAGLPGFGGYSGNGGQATAAELNYPVGICLDRNLNIYVADQNNNVIRKITTGTGVITTVAGNHVAGFSGNGGQATAARINNPTGVAVDNTGKLYIADYNNNEVRVVSTTGIIADFAGTGTANFNGYSGTADTTQLANPTGVSTDIAGNVYISDAGNAVIREVITSTNQMYTIAGIVFDGYSGDSGPALSAEIDYPFDVVTDRNSNVYIADLNNNVIRKIPAGCSIDTTTALVYNYPGCNGSADGTVIAFSNSPFQPYVYSWSAAGNTNQEVTGLSAGNYSVTITDAVGCTAMSSVILTQPTAIIANSSVISNVNCFGMNEGIASVSASGGESPYNYSWTPRGGSSATATGLPAGTYTVTLADYTGCVATVSTIITQPATAVSISISSNTSPNCNGGTGSAIANAATGGISPYIYSWSSGAGTNLSAPGLSAGTYIITATDALGCNSTASVVITQPLSISTQSVNSNVSCNGNSDGTASVSASGGTGTLSYSWAPSGGNSATANGLQAGTYTITVTDNNGCTAMAYATITQPTVLTAFSSINSNVICNGNSDGSITVSAGGGTGALTYSWAPSGGSSATANGLQAGSYTVTVTDNNGCTAMAFATITAPTTLLVNQDSVNQTSLTCNGISEVVPGGGTAPYTYMWTTGGQTTASITGQCAGTYCCITTDNNGCTQTNCVTINLATGINTISNTTSINIYPDPNTGYFTISGVTKGQTVELYNYIGQRISSTLASANTLHFNISVQPNGIYLIRILSKDGVLVSQNKFVKTE